PDAPDGGPPQALEKRATPEVRTVEQLEQFFGLPASTMAKTLLYEATWSDRTEVVAVMMRGDLDVNEVKLGNALDCLTVRLCDDDTIRRTTGAETGFAGPVGLPDTVRLIADETLRGRTNLLTGCNTTGYHCLNVNFGRDCRMPEFRDVRLARAGETAPDGK